MTGRTSPPEESDGVYTFHYSPEEDGQPVIAIVRAIAWMKGVDPSALDPLHHTVDTGELYQYFSSDPPENLLFRSGGTQLDHSARFIYEGCDVEVVPETITVERL